MPIIRHASQALVVNKHFGKEIIAKLIADNGYDKPITAKLVDDMYDRVYKNFVEHIDGNDNVRWHVDHTTACVCLFLLTISIIIIVFGIVCFLTKGVEAYTGQSNYRVTSTLPYRVARFNPSWREKVQDFNSGFAKAVALTGTELCDVVAGYVNSFLPARDIVEEAINKAPSELAADYSIVALPQFCPWQEHLRGIEKEMGIEGKVKYVLFGDAKGWRIQCVPLSDTGFQNRLSLPAQWRGLRDEELSTVSGIPGCVFVHASGFIGGNATREGVIAMAKKAIELAQQQEQQQKKE